MFTCDIESGVCLPFSTCLSIYDWTCTFTWSEGKHSCFAHIPMIKVFFFFTTHHILNMCIHFFSFSGGMWFSTCLVNNINKMISGIKNGLLYYPRATFWTCAFPDFTVGKSLFTSHARLTLVIMVASFSTCYLVNLGFT